MAYILNFNPQQRIYLGSINDATNLQFLKSNQIKAIINCIIFLIRGTIETPNVYEFKEEFLYLRVNIGENDFSELLKWSQICLEYIQKHSEFNILIHSQFGNKRAPAIMIGILGLIYPIEVKRILFYMQIKKPDIQLDIDDLQIDLPLQQEEHIYQKEIKQQLDKELTQLFKCKQCRVQIFTSLELIHGLKSTCSSYFVVKPKQVNPELMDGKFNCQKCNSKIGDFKLTGTKCGCGQWIAPSYLYQKSKIDRAF
ncbi:hypothetical protein pb186bvf_005251 [Paramecium bursaria]